MDSNIPNSQLCSVCAQMDFHALMFRPQDAKLLLDGGPWDLTFTNDNTFQPVLGRTSDIRRRAESCSLCKMITTVIHNHVKPGLLETIDADDSYYWKLGLSSCGSFGPSKPNPPYTKDLQRVHLASVKIFADGQHRIEGVFLHHIIQGAERTVPSVKDFEPGSVSNLRNATLRPSGRFYEPFCNMELLRTWLQDCQQNHIYNCRRVPSEVSLLFRLIDVTDMCLTHFDCPKDHLPSYCALSYVWGSSQQPVQLTSATFPTLIQHGALAHVSLPRTIADAIRLVKDLGHRYLWVDSICILQDDPEDQKRQIPLMREIYSNSVLTIIAASGHNCDRGLPGLVVPRQKFKQDAVILENMALINCCTPVEDSSSIHISGSRWNTRGWTMQERLFSPRCLIFTDDQVHWQCPTTSCCEETCLETSPDLRFWHISFDSFFMRPDHVNQHPRYSIYRFRELVKDYTARQLSYDRDALNAFLGIAQYYNVRGNIPCDWGIPVTAFECCLCWFGFRDIASRADNTFPSWSWLAWRHPIEFIVIEQDAVCILCYKVQSKSDGTMDLIPTGSEQIAYDDRLRDQIIQEKRTVALADVSHSVMPLLMDNFHILFWTGVASFKMGQVREIHDMGLVSASPSYLYTELYQSSAEIDYRSANLELDKSKAWPPTRLSNGAVGFCYGRLSEGLRKTQTKRMAFVLLSRCTQHRHPFPNPGDTILAMLVSWDGGIAKREALALIQRAAWLLSKPKQELIVLG